MASSQQQQQQQQQRAESSAIYELRMYTIYTKDFANMVKHFNEHHETLTKHAKPLGFWMTEIGRGISQFIHMWGYDSLSQRKRCLAVRFANPDWIKNIVAPMGPTIQDWENALVKHSPGSRLNADFTKDPSAVYLFEEAKVDGGYKNLPKVPGFLKGGGILVGRFCTILGASNTEYRLWRFPDIDAAGEAASDMAMNASPGNRTTLLTPLSFSPLH